MALITYRHTCRCGATAGTAHDPNCDIARCAAHGMQLIQCDPTCEPDTWTGYYPGELEAIEYGFFTRWKPEGGWEPCDPGHPDARPDLNTLMGECTWDPTTQRYALPT